MIHLAVIVGGCVSDKCEIQSYVGKRMRGIRRTLLIYMSIAKELRLIVE